MARKTGPTISQEELYPLADEPEREEVDDARLLDLDVEQEPPFLRVQKRVPVRRGSLPKKTVTRLTWGAVALGIVFLCGITVASLYHYGERSWRFRVESSDDIEINGLQNVARSQVMEVMGGDIGRNIFFIPLAQQKTQLEQIPWVESASVMRFVPNRLKVEIHERTPVAFARVGPRMFLIDAGGTLMELSPKHKYSFPVILGMNPGEPLSTRAPRMKSYAGLVRELDSGGAHYSQDLSEVDLTDLEDLKVRVNDPAGDVLVHLGSSDFLHRFKIYVSHAQAWRQQFQKLESVNLRYDNQVIVNPDMEKMAKPVPLSATAARTAAAAGVKPAALLTRIGPHDRAVPKPAFELTDRKLDPKATATKPKKAQVKARAKKTARPWKASARKNAAPAVKSAAKKSGVSQKPSPAVAKGQASAGTGD